MQSEVDSRAGLETRVDARSELDASPETNLEAQRERKFWIAMGMYGVLAALCWFTLGEGTTSVLGRRVEIRYIPLCVLGTLVFRTWVAREAERLRRRSRQ